MPHLSWLTIEGEFHNFVLFILGNSKPLQQKETDKYKVKHFFHHKP
jgi:hypothetical protein